jgi:hypothetical protein
MPQRSQQSRFSSRARCRVRILGLVALLAAAVAAGPARCGPDDAVVITYKPVAAFDGYVMSGYADPPAFAGEGKAFVYYRISSIANRGSDAKSFTLDYSRFSVQNDDGEGVRPMSAASLWNGTFPWTFVNGIVTVPAHQTLEFPMGADAPRFIVWQSKSTGYQRVRYDSKGAPQPVTVVSENGAQPVTVERMESKALFDLR